MNQETYEAAEGTSKRSAGTKLFLGMLVAVAFLYSVILTYHVTTPVETVTSDDAILEQCRQLCLKYGLVTTGHVKNDAEAYLAAAGKVRLSRGIMDVLSDPNLKIVPSEQHALLQKSAPDFSLKDDHGDIKTLSVLGKNRPVVVVFYLGYGCSHCVAQLIGIEEDLHYFKELDVDVVAISSDTPEYTTERFAEYGRFTYPVLSDPDNAIATAWDVYEPAAGETDEVRLHGTFVIDRTGKVIWAETGSEPFLDNRTLLHVLAKSQGLLPDVAERRTSDQSEALTRSAAAD